MDDPHAASGSLTQVKNGREWRIGSRADIAWIVQGTAPRPGITAAVPSIFTAYCTVARPESLEGAQQDHDRAVVGLLAGCTEPQPWWLGYLEMGVGAEEVVFYDAPRVQLYQDWNYVLVEAGPEQALAWRQSEGPRAPWKGALPDIMFPSSRSWLWTTLWDDPGSCVGGPQALVDTFARDPTLGRLTTIVDISDTDIFPEP